MYIFSSSLLLLVGFSAQISRIELGLWISGLGGGVLRGLLPDSSLFSSDLLVRSLGEFARMNQIALLQGYFFFCLRASRASYFPRRRVLIPWLRSSSLGEQGLVGGYNLFIFI